VMIPSEQVQCTHWTSQLDPCYKKCTISGFTTGNNVYYRWQCILQELSHVH